MLKTLLARIKQGYRTIPYPFKRVNISERYLGKPEILEGLTQSEINKCKNVCPVDAIGENKEKNSVFIDVGRCIFCGECKNVSDNKINFTKNYRLSEFRREDLLIYPEKEILEKRLRERIKHIFGRSLKLRQVSAGGCNACELDINVLNTLAFDLGRFGIQFVASPRHADGIVVTGPVSQNMKLALQKTYDAIPSPKLVIAVGSCAISGGPYFNHEEVCNGVDSILKVDLYIPGCPPHPLTILTGLLKLMKGR
ncbi:MAG TPA: NADH-quinone oxidoreductase subunit NuoB [Spirochaetota bacterium]|nr:NADH-quinone oxidoreductase subunit NuoB [Spirochaetota bacterium]HOL56407.1 NADH-quinone oxidoreductase subunit NuoB [Spirochaetota bacterium]HPP03891.1 NADH-quinone oxidoreductase subunit NuoB [Spirochaetota bacterium]